MAAAAALFAVAPNPCRRSPPSLTAALPLPRVLGFGFKGLIGGGSGGCLVASPRAAPMSSGVKGERDLDGVSAAVVGGGDGDVVKPIIVIDNYDSFTYNLCQYIGELGVKFEVYRNDEITVDDIERKKPKGVLISPGPGEPKDSGISMQTVLELGPTIPIFGVCMGLQCIGEAFGGKIVRAPSGVMHGKTSLVYYDEKQEDTLFQGLPNPFTVCRYHSLVIENASCPDVLEITAWTADGLIMAARHKNYKHIQGVQFHPESIFTPDGKAMVSNFFTLIDKLQKK